VPRAVLGATCGPWCLVPGVVIPVHVRRHVEPWSAEEAPGTEHRT